MLPPQVPLCWLCDEPVLEGMPAVRTPDGEVLHLSCVTYVAAMQPGPRAYFLHRRQQGKSKLTRKEPLS